MTFTDRSQTATFAALGTPTITTAVTIVTLVDDLPLLESQRCGCALGHINGLTKDSEWHCHLPGGS
jgi:hypothetical protein